VSKVTPDHVISCPRCGASTELRNPGIITLVCSGCQTTIYREGAALRAGKSSSLIPSSSGIQVSTQGRLAGKKFDVVGRIRFEHSQGGWDEWYCEDEHGHSLWLVEDEGRFFLEKAVEKALPTGIEDAGIGDEFTVLGQRFQVVEAGEGTVRGGEGQLPRGFEPWSSFRYVDLSAIGGDERLTLEISGGEVEAFIGRLVPRDELSFPKNYNPPSTREKAAGQDCGGCGAALEIVALPEPTLTISCGHCGAIYGVEGQKLSQLHGAQECPTDMHLEIGARGTVFGTDWEVVGRMVYEEFELDEGFWNPQPSMCHEYLVRSDEGELRTIEITAEGIVLVRKLTELPPVHKMAYLAWGHSMTFGDKKYRMYERGRSVLVYVDGALPWRAEIGDDSGFVDCIDRPGALSDRAASRLSLEWPNGREDPGDDGELEAFIADPISLDEFTSAFTDAGSPIIEMEILGVNKVPVRVFRFGCLTSLMSLVGLFVIFVVGMSSDPILGSVTVDAQSYPAEGMSEPFEIASDTTLIGIEVDTNLNNSWTYIEYDLIDASTQKSIAYIPAEVSYYHGIEGGESWAEGKRSSSRTFVAPAPGTYQLSLSVEEGERPVVVEASVRRRLIDTRWPLRATIFLLVMGLIQVFRRITGVPNLWPSEDEDD
jgi:hypothetical protein